MRSLMINGQFVDITSKTAKGVEIGCVGMCSDDQCLNEGVCEEFYDRFECQCADTPFEGEYCSEGEFECLQNLCLENNQL